MYQKLDIRVPRISQTMGLMQFEQGLSSFFAKFLAYLMIFQSSTGSAFCILHFEKSSNMAKICPKMKKILAELAFNSFFRMISGVLSEKLHFRVPESVTIHDRAIAGWISLSTYA